MGQVTLSRITSFLTGVLLATAMPARGQFFPNGPLVPPNPIPVPVYVRVIGPDGASVVFYGSGGKPHRLPMPSTVGLTILNTYYFCLESLPGLEGKPFYGTIETIGAPHVPPPVKISSVPIPLRINDEDLFLLAREQLITKFIVLEDPDFAMPVPTDADQPIVYDASDAKDPLKRAKEIGKLMLVVRIGNRIPTQEELRGGGTRTIFVARSVDLRDAAGKDRKSEEYFVNIETGATAPIVPVSHMRRRLQNQQPPWKPSPANVQRPGSCGTDRCAPGSGGFANGEVTFAPGPQRVDLPILSGNFGGDDQFLCDGGDDGLQAGFVDGRILVNVDPSDTVAEYRDAAGKLKVIPSNCVCIFAPRFAEVRYQQGLSGFDARELPADLIRDRALAGMTQRAREIEKLKYERLAAIKTRQRPTSIASEQWAGVLTEVRVLAAYEGAVGWAQMIGLLGIAELKNSEQAWIASRVQFAKTLTQVQSPQIIAMTEGAGQLITVWRHDEIRQYEEVPGKTCLEIVKCASVSEAKPGDTVEFQISFTNHGDAPATNVAIVDSLVGRLAYVENSAQSDRKATFVAQRNEVGSHILRWELHDPLRPGETGTVTFKTVVR